jgi:hypothetical protein
MNRMIYVGLLLAVVVPAGWAQSEDQNTDITLRYGGVVGSVFGPENPAVSSLDEATPGAEPRSYLLPALHFSQSLNSNGGDRDHQFHTVTRGFGSLEFQRMWKRYQTNINYVGGGAYYTNRTRDAAQLQDLTASQVLHWKRGMLSLRDAFSFLPEGSFGHGSFGGAGGGGEGGAGHGAHFGSLGQAPRITNEVILSAMETLSPRAAVTVGGTYGRVHFTDNTDGLIDSSQISAHAGYSYQLNRTNQVGVLYGFQDFHFPREESSAFTTHLVHATFAHRITGRMDLTLAGGPQVTLINSPIFPDFHRLSFSGRASVRYAFSRTEVRLSYRRYTTGGSGLFAGAQTDGVRLSATRPLSRLWEATADLGYSHNSRIVPRTGDFDAHTFQSAYAGLAMRRRLGPDLVGVVRYQFANLNSDGALCGGVSSSCGRLAERHTITFGLDWYLHPIHLD